MSHRTIKRSRLRAATGAALVSVILATAGAAADDRDILLESAGSPYLFVVFDTSTSMTQTPPCSRERALSDMDPYDAMCTVECPFDDARCEQLCPNQGCREYDFTAASPPDTEPDIKRNNVDATLSGSWPAAVIDGTAYLGDYLQDAATANCGDLFNDFTQCYGATYDPDSPAADLSAAGAGYYMIFLWWPEGGASFATNTLVAVQHDDPESPATAVTSKITVNQKLEGGRWNAIGTYFIDPSGNANKGQVTINNEHANGVAVADGVGWLKVGDQLPPCLGPEVYRCQQPICNGGDCYTGGQIDDPRSKMFQAKQSLYEVIADVPNIQYGFATFEQDQLRLGWKHWLYRVAPAADQPGALPTLGGTDFLSGAAEVFGNGTGDGWSCNTGFFDGSAGCPPPFSFFGPEPADVTNPWEIERARRIPKLGRDGTDSTTVLYRVNRTTTYTVVYTPSGGAVTLGAPQISVDVEVFLGAVSVSSGTVLYNLASDYVALDGLLGREPMRSGGFFQGQSNAGANLANSCFGLDGNDDADATDSTCNRAVDPPELFCDAFDPAGFTDYSLRWPTDISDPRGRDFYVGDFVPFDWQDKHRRTLLGRLAPNVAGGGDVPDFRSAVYFADTLDTLQDSTVAAERLLRLKDEDERPLLAFGNTPLGESLFEFQTWYENPTFDGTGAINGDDVGWADVADTDDQLWACRQKALLVLTDGTEFCLGRTKPGGIGTFDHDACDVAADLFDPPNALGFTPDDEALRKVETYVVGFGLPGGAGSSLACMAQNGRALGDVDTGGDDPYLFLPENKDDLAADLQEIFLRLQLESRAFASAALPAVQSTAADNIYLSSFTPLVGKPFWPGRLDAFRRPLPLTALGEPDVERDCVTNSLQSACHSWEAGEKMCAQAPDAVDAASGIFQLGDDPATERRILYGQASDCPAPPPRDCPRPNALRLFEIPDLPADPVPPAANPALGADAEDLVTALDPAVLRRYEANRITPSALGEVFKRVIGRTVRLKENGLDPADPEVLFPDGIGGCDTTGDGFNDSYVLGDVFHANPIPVLSPNNFTYFADNVNGYRDFARENVWRRRMLAVAANDGQLHFIDVGVRQLVDNDFTSDPSDKIELFNDGSGHELFSYIPRFALPILRQQVDSSQHIYSLDGTVAVADVYVDPVAATGGADPAEREWRTVVIGGLREGGDVFFEDEQVRNFKSGYFALDVTRPDIMNTRTNLSDPTLVPCPASAAGCDDTTTGLPAEWVPSCLSLDYPPGDGSQAAPPANCAGLFPAELWTFADSLRVYESELTPADDGVSPDELLTFYLDEDENGIPDLADTWSRPVIGQIRVCKAGGTLCDPNPADPADDDDLEIVQVAIFGGGMDPRRKGQAEVGGNYLYMVDVETGDLIYKRQLECPPTYATCGGVGSVAGDPAVIDANRDGYFDVVYIGTTEGKLFKVDLTLLDDTGLVPRRETFTVDTEQLLLLDAVGGAKPFADVYVDPPPADNIARPPRVFPTDPADDPWKPFLIFDSGGSPIYHAPSAFYIPELDEYGLAFGTGDREDLWGEDNGENTDPPVGGRFFVIVDQDLAYDEDLYDLGVTPSCLDRLPIIQGCIKNFAFDVDPDPVLELKTDYLLNPKTDTGLLAIEPNPRPGWALTLTPDSRITVEAFLVSGIVVFSAFDPEIVTVSAENCQQTGTTRAFVVAVKNAGPIVPFGGNDDDGNPSTPLPKPIHADDRFQAIQDFTTAPFIDTTATKNPDVQGETILDEINEELANAVRNALVGQYPRGSRFNSAFSLVIAALRNSTGVDVYATVPIAIYPADWKDQ